MNASYLTHERFIPPEEFTDDSYEDKDTALAEFNALRAEVLARITIQQNILTLQLGAAGAVLSFALASSGPVGATCSCLYCPSRRTC